MANTVADAQATHWGMEIERAKKRYRTFWDNGDQVIDTYRMQKADGNDVTAKDKYNILFSSTETIRPNLYAQTPKTRVMLRSKDTANDTARLGALLLEGSIEYVKTEEDFDELMNSAVEDLLLPGLGQGWVRYEPRFGDKTDDDGKPIPAEGGKKGEYEQELLDEMVEMEYVYWQDFLTGVGRTWKQTPWVAKRLWLSKPKATARFGAEKDNKLQYQVRESSARDMDNPAETAEAWEIWDKETKMVYWWAEGLPELLDQKKDPLKLKKFFPCPRPLRAISNTRTFVPRALYSQYKSQAETLNVLTKRIRLLGEALRVVGLYNGAEEKLADLLNPAAGNRMIAVNDWAMFAQNGGITGNVVWLPIDAVVKTLNETLTAREVCKNEIYEITGFSDIVRGVSKASETLGAQNLKANWASARVKRMQAEVQRFARDMLALVGELIAEHCEETTIAIFSGIQIPTGEEVQASQELQERMKLFKDACAFLKNELRRVSTVDIETDSTLMADDAIEREDRAKFLAAAGAFLQQAVPAMEATPELGPLLGAMLMFTVRSFPSARIIEDEFEKVQKSMAARAPEQDKDGKKATAEAAKAKLEQEGKLKTQELKQTSASEAAKLQLDTKKEENRHSEKMAELAVREREVTVEEKRLALDTKLDTFKALHEAGMSEEEHFGAKDDKVLEIADAGEQRTHEASEAEADRTHETDEAAADRDHQAEEGEAERGATAEAAQTAADAKGPPAGGGDA